MHLFAVQQACTMDPVDDVKVAIPAIQKLDLSHISAKAPESDPMECDEPAAQFPTGLASPPRNPAGNNTTSSNSPVSTPRGFFTPLGSPRTPRADTVMRTPVAPSRISPRTQPSPGRSSRVVTSPMKMISAQSAAFSPRSVKLSGSARLVGDNVVQLPAGSFAFRDLDNGVGDHDHHHKSRVQRALPFADVAKPRAKSVSPLSKSGKSWAKDRALPPSIRELSFADLLLHDPSSGDQAGELLAVPAVGGKFISRSLPATPRDIDVLLPNEMVSPRKRARKSAAPERATCDDGAAPCEQQPSPTKGSRPSRGLYC